METFQRILKELLYWITQFNDWANPILVKNPETKLFLWGILIIGIFYFFDYVLNNIRAFGLLLLAIGIVMHLFGFFYLNMENLSFENYVEYAFANISTSFLDLAVTILIVDRIYHRAEARKEAQKEKYEKEIERIELEVDLNSGSDDLLKKAITTIQHKRISSIKFPKLELIDQDFLEIFLSGAQLDKTNLRKSRISKGNFSKAFLNNVILSDAEIDSSDFSHVRLNNCIGGKLVKPLEVSRSDFSNAIFTKCDFSNSNFHAVNFQSAFVQLDSKFENDEFSLCNFNFSSFNNSEMDNVTIYQVETNIKSIPIIDIMISPKFRACSMNHFNIYHPITIYSATFNGSSLVKSNFQESWIINCEFKNSTLTDTILSQCWIVFSDFSKSQLLGADFSNTEFLGSSFNNSILIGSDFTKANLQWVNFRGADLSFSNFSNAKVTMKQLEMAANLNGIILPDGTKYRN